jgi:hypothetical protein
MINFTQAHYLFAAAAMLEELSLMFPQDNRDATPTPPTPPSALKEERQNLEKEPVVGINPQPKEKAVMPEPVQAKDEPFDTLRAHPVLKRFCFCDIFGRCKSSWNLEVFGISG